MEKNLDTARPAAYLTVRTGAEAAGELTDRKSRFIAQLAHAGSIEEADAFIAAVRARHHDARHNVPAWVLADGRERASDDGEPQRTAGVPVLDVLRGAGLRDVCCVVTRYFGGTLLGPGGLVRAYSGAAAAAVERARADGLVAEMTLVAPVEARVPYALYDRVRRLAADAGGHEGPAEFTDEVLLRLRFRSGEEAGFLASLKELANGAELARALPPRFEEL